MYRKAVMGAALALVCAFIPNTCLAQDNLAAELYGRGVHAYYASQFEQALGYLSESIEAEPTDPRPYYFRGLVQSNLGEAEKSTADFKLGAEMEVSSDERHYDIGRSLQRVQGPLRLAIEGQRADARLTLKRAALKRKAARYRDLEAAEKQVLVDPDKPAPAPPKPAEAPANTSDPFGDGTPAPPAETGAEPAPAKPAADPFDTPAPAKPAADPFDTPAPTKPAADPFDTPAPAKPANPPTEPADTDGAAVKPTSGGAKSLFSALLKVATPKIPTTMPSIPGIGGPGAPAPDGAPKVDPFKSAPGSDPFAPPAKSPPAADDAADPFKNDNPPAKDPFGKPAGDDPFGAKGSKPAEGSNPFGDN